MHVIGVDVGTTSVRLAIIAFSGKNLNEVNVLGCHKKDIKYFQDGCKFEQSSREIWNAICECSRECLRKSDIEPSSIKSIAFSATCSLVIHYNDCTTQCNSKQNDIIMWMDHRALKEASEISESGSKVLNQFGGTCSPEFSLAKLKWLKNHDPTRAKSADGFFELPDWLVFRCVGGDPSTFPRSLCSVTCKWGYSVEKQSHSELIDSKFFSDKIGQTIFYPGSSSGYLCPSSANELGLLPESQKENLNELKITVGTSLIDAHSGMLAMLSIPLNQYKLEQNVESTLCSLAGTSSCHMLLSGRSNFIPGIWGPYKDVVLQGYYLLEAGQSLTGKLIEICIETHIEGEKLLKDGKTMYEIINDLNELLKDAQMVADLHILPTFHGNRSPLGNPRLKGGVYGLSSQGPKSLLEYYSATIESIGYETKYIVESLGAELKNFLVSGGLMKNTFYMQTMANILQCRVIGTSLEDIDFMVMGSGLIARQAALYPASIPSAGALTHESIHDIKYHQLKLVTYEPSAEQFGYHDKKYRCYREFVRYSQKVDEIMQS